MRKLTLYGRPECHLCDAFLEELLPLLPPDVVVEKVDVDTDEGLARRYGMRIPVLADGDVEISGYPLDRERVLRHLEPV